MSDWEDAEGEAIGKPVNIKNKWDDEDKEEDVKESWEDSDESEKEEEKTAAAPIKKKIPLAQKIAEKKAIDDEKKRKLEEKKAELEALDNETEEEKFERLQRLKDMEVEADLKNAEELFGGASISKKSENDKPLEEVKPRTRAEFESYGKRLAEMITAHSGRSTYNSYADFVDALVRDISVPLKDSDVRKAASTLTALANNKQREAKDAQKSKKKGKPALAAAGKSGNSAAQERNLYDDFDDFM